MGNLTTEQKLSIANSFKNYSRRKKEMLEKLKEHNYRIEDRNHPGQFYVVKGWVTISSRYAYTGGSVLKKICEDDQGLYLSDNVDDKIIILKDADDGRYVVNTEIGFGKRFVNNYSYKPCFEINLTHLNSKIQVWKDRE